MEAASSGGMLYHKVEEGKLCVNIALQEPFFFEFDLAALNANLDQREHQVMLEGASGAATTAMGDFLGENESSHNVSLGVTSTSRYV